MAKVKRITRRRRQQRKTKTSRRRRVQTRRVKRGGDGPEDDYKRQICLHKKEGLNRIANDLSSGCNALSKNTDPTTAKNCAKLKEIQDKINELNTECPPPPIDADLQENIEFFEKENPDG